MWRNSTNSTRSKKTRRAGGGCAGGASGAGAAPIGGALWKDRLHVAGDLAPCSGTSSSPHGVPAAVPCSRTVSSSHGVPAAASPRLHVWCIDHGRLVGGGGGVVDVVLNPRTLTTSSTCYSAAVTQATATAEHATSEPTLPNMSNSYQHGRPEAISATTQPEAHMCLSRKARTYGGEAESFA